MSIEDVINRADLADRSVFLMLEPICERHRRSESELWREFEIARPRLLGTLLDAAVHGLQTLPNVCLTSLPRMADFPPMGHVMWNSAVAPAGTFARAYDANRRAAVEGIIETDPVAGCVRKLMAERGNWAGTASELLRAAIALPGDDADKDRRLAKKIPVPSPADCAVRRHSFACWALT